MRGLLLLVLFSLLVLAAMSRSAPYLLRSGRLQLRAFANASSAPELLVGVHPIQGIYDSLKQIPRQQLQSSVNNPSDCKFVGAALILCDRVTLDDLAISKSILAKIEKDRLCRCLNVCSDSDFEINVFVLPKGKSLPLHDHPGMTVISKVLTGNLHLRSFSKCDEPASRSAKRAKTSSAYVERQRQCVLPGLACIKTAADPAWFLSPSTDNVHELEAQTTCVVFDILMPPYRPPERDCHFYALGVAETVEDGKEMRELIPSVEPDDADSVYRLQYDGVRPKKRTT